MEFKEQFRPCFPMQFRFPIHPKNAKEDQHICCRIGLSMVGNIVLSLLVLMIQDLRMSESGEIYNNNINADKSFIFNWQEKYHDANKCKRSQCI